MRHPQLDEILGKLRLYLESCYGDRLEQIVLYGFQARGDAALDSDGQLYFFSDICMDYSVLVSQVFAHRDWVEYHPSPFYKNLRHEGVLV